MTCIGNTQKRTHSQANKWFPHEGWGKCLTTTKRYLNPFYWQQIITHHMLAGCENEILLHSWWAGQLIQELRRAIWKHLKVKNKHSLQPGSSVSRHPLTEQNKDIGTGTSISTVCKREKWKELKDLLIKGWRIKL